MREQKEQPATLDVQLAASVLGRMGGLALARKHPEVLRVIGSRGGQETARRYPGMARVWGKQGGRPKKRSLQEMERGCSGGDGGDPPAAGGTPSTAE